MEWIEEYLISRKQEPNKGWKLMTKVLTAFQSLSSLQLRGKTM
jgi:hypothetical protein